MTSNDDCGLRERKKRQTRADLHRAAIELAVERGDVAAVTVEEMAARAGVSARTFFNYFATKEAALLGSDPDTPAIIEESLLGRPADEPPLTSLRETFRVMLAALEEDRAAWVARRTLFDSNPELLPVLLGKNHRHEQAAVKAMRARMDRPAPDPLPTIIVGAAIGAVRGAMLRYWYEPETPLNDCLDGSFDVLEEHWRS
ncbi:TetR/AcrR family transcriptional regulator [Kribbia dieselivorans]|uniref:TetR/AcrR family transcriptional regulator n=1 Tax=Kribbia dieselivorans TaxID=331526 RepID=UPI0014706932|nr:TetR family transcriptional regulator [Kribbia dieselivorans]